MAGKPTGTELMRQLREIAKDSAEAARKAVETAARHQDALEAEACKRAGVKQKFLPLLRSVDADPLTGACACDSRTLNEARDKMLVTSVFGGMNSISSTRANMSGNTWFELGPLGQQIMRDIHGDDWAYEPPSTKFAIAAA